MVLWWAIQDPNGTNAKGMMANVPPNTLPSSLWREGRYHVPPAIRDSYVEKLIEKDLIDIATLPNNKKGKPSAEFS